MDAPKGVSTERRVLSPHMPRRERYVRSRASGANASSEVERLGCRLPLIAFQTIDQKHYAVETGCGSVVRSFPRNWPCLPSFGVLTEKRTPTTSGQDEKAKRVKTNLQDHWGGRGPSGGLPIKPARSDPMEGSAQEDLSTALLETPRNPVDYESHRSCEP